MKKTAYRVIINVLIGLALVLLFWQIVQYRKLKFMFYEEGREYAINQNLPSFFVEHMQKQRQQLFKKLSVNELHQLEGSISPVSLNAGIIRKTIWSPP